MNTYTAIDKKDLACVFMCSSDLLKGLAQLFSERNLCYLHVYVRNNSDFEFSYEKLDATPVRIPDSTSETTLTKITTTFKQAGALTCFKMVETIEKGVYCLVQTTYESFDLSLKDVNEIEKLSTDGTVMITKSKSGELTFSMKNQSKAIEQ